MPREPKEVSNQGFLDSHSSKTTKRLASRNAHAFAVFGIGACFMVWASLFIYKSSFVGIDGRRYFCLIDDAMISMRYAWMLSHGYGFVWNPGEYVEGYTNPLMALLMAVPTLLLSKGSAVLAVQVFGVAVVLANACILVLISRRLEVPANRVLFDVIAFCCGLAYYPLAWWALWGMETGLL